MKFDDLVIADSEKEQNFLRMCISAPTKGGKTFTALRLAFSISSNIILIDTENGRASLYDGESVDGKTWKWKTIRLNPPYSIARYRAAIEMAVSYGADVLIVDSLSDEWEGEGGALDWHSQLGGRFNDWATVTPEHNKLMDLIEKAPVHIIATMRSKMDYLITEDESSGRRKQKVERVGLAPVQRGNVPYRYDFELSMDQAHNATLVTRMRALDGWRGNRPGPELMPPIMSWLNSGKEYAWLPDWSEFYRIVKNQVPSLIAGKSDKEAGAYLGKLIKEELSITGWEPARANEAKELLLSLEAEAARLTNEAEALPVSDTEPTE
jgi:hypothetical protein